MEEKLKNSIFNTNISSKDWLGEVVDNDDPDREYSCRIRVFGLFDTLDVGDIPWATPASNNQISGNGFSAGSVPKKGTILKVRFNNGSIYNPEYYASQHINSDLKQLLDEFGSDYFNSNVICYDKTEELKCVYSKTKGLELSLKNSKINITPDNAIDISCEKKITIKTGNTTIYILPNGTIDIDAKGSILLGGNTGVVVAEGLPPGSPIVDVAQLSVAKKLKTS
jgi:hypothetical protein